MTEVPVVDAAAGPDADLLEYLLVAVPTAGRLDGVVATVAGLVRSGRIGLIDVVLLHRAEDQASVAVRSWQESGLLAPLAGLADPRARLSAHDVALAAVAVEPGVSALLLLVEDRWAAALAATAREAGGRVLGGERVGRDRFRSAVGASVDGADRWAIADLLVRGPATSLRPELAVDPAAQLQTLAELVDRGVLTLEQYEAQRRRVLDG
ncbi:SHOCT domain-containing protein [Isoptericola cucumis]|uniref:SHOCT domain-containing protein n=1 Tax=Isoptericola cucumis TaxID=1776856 RepID=A0ABQ2B737_9MICO|nr:SHOCT domain-containing protein [Isoptericola cucumis]GGI09564.1 hypothetical protein GCM10007368_26810 [Isoptericola cucumis]